MEESLREGVRLRPRLQYHLPFFRVMSGPICLFPRHTAGFSRVGESGGGATRGSMPKIEPCLAFGRQRLYPTICRQSLLSSSLSQASCRGCPTEGHDANIIPKLSCAMPSPGGCASNSAADNLHCGAQLDQRVERRTVCCRHLPELANRTHVSSCCAQVGGRGVGCSRLTASLHFSRIHGWASRRGWGGRATH